MKTLGELGVTAVIELPPAGTLVGLVKRALPGVETLALKTPDDLDAARALIEKHAHDIEFAATPSWRLLVQPSLLEVPVIVIGSGVRRSKLLLPGRLAAELPGAEVVEGLAG